MARAVSDRPVLDRYFRSLAPQPESRSNATQNHPRGRPTPGGPGRYRLARLCVVAALWRCLQWRTFRAGVGWVIRRPASRYRALAPARPTAGQGCCAIESVCCLARSGIVIDLQRRGAVFESLVISRQTPRQRSALRTHSTIDCGDNYCLLQVESSDNLPFASSRNPIVLVASKRRTSIARHHSLL
jgi:hypothetical protein